MKVFSNHLIWLFFSLSNIDETPLEDKLNVSLAENDITALENHFTEVCLKRLFSIRGINEITAALLINQSYGQSETQDLNLLLIAGTHNAVYLRSSQDDVVRLNLPDTYQGIKYIYNLENFM